MKKRSPLSTLVLLVVVAAAGYAVYRWAIKPMMDKRAMDKAMEKGCEEVAQKFEEKREEIAQDLAMLLEKLEASEAQAGEQNAPAMEDK